MGIEVGVVERYIGRVPYYGFFKVRSSGQGVGTF